VQRAGDGNREDSTQPGSDAEAPVVNAK
jgi:hypothetical protein